MMTWIALKGETVDFLVEKLGCRHNEKVSADFFTPIFYRNGVLLRLTTDGVSRLFIGGGSTHWKDKRFFLLDGRSMPIHAGNKAAKITIRTAYVAGAYLRFFCSVLRAENGPFNILDALPCGCDADAFGGTGARPLKVVEDKEHGCFAATACVEYAGDLFMADFRIWRDGMVEMTEDYPLACAAAPAYAAMLH